MAEAKKNIYEKLLIVKKQVSYIQKDKDSHQYKYASPSAVLSRLNPLLNKEGLILKPEVVEIYTERIFLKPKMVDLWIDGKKTGKEIDVHETLFRLRMRMTWVDTVTGEKDVNEWASSGVNGDEKGFGSALTYGLRYFLLSFFNIATDNDDPDTFQTKHMTSDEVKALEEKMKAKLIAEINNSETPEALLNLRENNLPMFNIVEVKNIANKKYEELSGKKTDSDSVKTTKQKVEKVEVQDETPKKRVSKKAVEKEKEEEAISVAEMMAEHDDEQKVEETETEEPEKPLAEIISESQKDKDDFIKSLDEATIDDYLIQIKNTEWEDQEAFIEWATMIIGKINQNERVQEFKDSCNEFYNNEENWKSKN